MNKDERRESLEAQVASFPDAPGVYLFKDTRGRVLYVGKADVLRDRVRAYFGPSLDVRHIRLVERAERVEFAVTGSISEAYLLEANLIKQHKPRYNIRLKDDKSYPYVKITLGEDFPRILRIRRSVARSAPEAVPIPDLQAHDPRGRRGPRAHRPAERASRWTTLPPLSPEALHRTVCREHDEG